MLKKLQEAKKYYIEKHPLSLLTIKELKAKAKKDNVFVCGDKAQILQCFDQSEQMTKLFRTNKK